jgi:hypothetical protein
MRFAHFREVSGTSGSGASGSGTCGFNGTSGPGGLKRTLRVGLATVKFWCQMPQGRAQVGPELRAPRLQEHIWPSAVAACGDWLDRTVWNSPTWWHTRSRRSQGKSGMGSARWCRPRITFFSTSCLARAPVPSPWRAPIPSAVYTATTNASGVPTVSRGFSPDPRNVVGGFANHSRSLRELPRENFRAGHDAVVIGSRRQAPGARPNPEPHAFETWRKPLVLNVLCALFRSVWHQCAPSVPVCPQRRQCRRVVASVSP